MDAPICAELPRRGPLSIREAPAHLQGHSSGQPAQTKTKSGLNDGAGRSGPAVMKSWGFG